MPAIHLLEPDKDSNGSPPKAQSSLLRRLAWSHPLPVPRATLLEDLFPETDPPEAQNRLRVAMSRLRQRHRISETPEGVRLEDVTVDISELRTTLNALRWEPDPAVELQSRRDLVPRLLRPLFPNAKLDWEINAQTEWASLTAAHLEELGTLAESLGLDTVVIEAAQETLELFPYDVPAWSRLLRAKARQGDRSTPIRRLAALRKHAIATDWPFPEALSEWLESFEFALEGSGLAPHFSPAESEVIERCIRRALLEEPEAAVALLGSNSFRPEVVRNPGATLPLLREAAAAQVPPSEAQERVLVRIITALSLLHRHPEVIKEATAFLKRPISDRRRRIALLTLSYSHAITGNLPLAFEAIEAARTLATGDTQAYDEAECIAQRGTFHLFAGDYAAAEADFRPALATIESHNLSNFLSDTVNIRANLALALALQGRTAEALEVCALTSDLAFRSGAARAEIAAFAVHAWIAATAGSCTPLLAERLAQAIKLAYRTSNARIEEILMYAAATAHLTGLDPNARLAAEVAAHCLATGNPIHEFQRHILRPGFEKPAGELRPQAELARDIVRRLAQLNDERAPA